jgi:lipopolysaccharide export system permease protein
MMKTIGWMLSRMILVRFLGILIGISVFVLTLEAVSYAKEILALEPGHALILLKYMLHRAPATLATFLPMSMLLAILLTLTELSYRNEITAIWATGVSPMRLVLLLLPVAFLTGGLHFLLSDQGVPAAAPQLNQWGVADYGEKKLRLSEDDPIWMRSGDDILRAKSSNAASTQLNDVIIFRRTPDGILREQIFAKTAKLDGDRWNLDTVVVYYRENLPPDRLDTLVYTGAMRPAAAGARTGDPEEMTFKELGNFISNSGFGIRPTWVYETWRQKRVALLFSTLVMIAICVPLATRFRRGGGLGILFAAGVALGFLFFVIDGIASTMGELGFVWPWMAAWMPVLLFGSLAMALGLRMDRV